MSKMPVVSLISLLLFFILLPLPIHTEAATPTTLGVAYRGHIQDYGDLPADNAVIEDGGLLGTTGESKRIEGFLISLTGDLATAQNYHIRYNVHIQNEGWQAATDNLLS